MVDMGEKMLFKATFERFNFGYEPPLHMSVDVLFDSDKDCDGMNPHDCPEDLWQYLWEQHPDWDNNYQPLKSENFYHPISDQGWCSILLSDNIEKVVIKD